MARVKITKSTNPSPNWHTCPNGPCEEYFMKRKTSSGKDIFKNNLEKKKEEIAYNKRLLDFSITIQNSLYRTPKIFVKVFLLRVTKNQDWAVKVWKAKTVSAWWWAHIQWMDRQKCNSCLHTRKLNFLQLFHSSWLRYLPRKPPKNEWVENGSSFQKC